MSIDRHVQKDLMACLQSLEQIRGALTHLPQHHSGTVSQYLDQLRSSLQQCLQEEPQEETAVQEECGSFSQGVKVEMQALGAEAHRRGVRLTCEFSPSMRQIPFANGGAILLGLVRQALAVRVSSDFERCLSVTARVDGRNRVVIGIQDSATGSRESFSIRELGQWRRRIQDMGGELSLRGVPFGEGTTIEANLPVQNLAA